MSMLSIITKTLGYGHCLYITVGPSGHSYVAENVVYQLRKRILLCKHKVASFPIVNQEDLERNSESLQG